MDKQKKQDYKEVIESVDVVIDFIEKRRSKFPHSVMVKVKELKAVSSEAKNHIENPDEPIALGLALEMKKSISWLRKNAL